MRRFALTALVLAACHHASPSAPARTECPGPYAIEPGTCQHAAATDCKGVCGYVLRRGSCAPVKNATLFQSIPNGTVPNAVVDDDGRFDLALPPGHVTVRVMADQDDGHFELDVAGGSQPLATPVELLLQDRTCGCGGVCPT